ncbi:MAG: tripartite tricarboxylate transporter substrate binding protein [Burkholderiales bacterium]|nr:tripartite tricarboxylate transporter substrate binding protein [Burkholderiales bacterium]
MDRTVRLAGALALALAAAGAAAQAYPTKAVRIVVTFPPGGSSDTIARLLAPQLAERFGQAFIVENRPGGGGGRTIGAAIVAKSAPDGYTLAIAGGSSFFSFGSSPSAGSYDPLKDLSPITRLVTSPMVVAVNPALLPVNSITELIALAKAKSGLAFGSGGNGSGMHMAGEMFKLMSRVDMLHVPYKGNAPAVNDLMAGQVQLAFVDLGSAHRFIKTGRLRVLAVASEARSTIAPEIPTAAESGLPGWEVLGSFGLFGPGGLPGPIVQRLNAETTALLRRPENRERILATGNESAPTTPEEYAAMIRSEIPRFEKVAKDSGVKFD